MTELDKAIKTYWYSRGFNKAPDTGWYQMELDAFSDGWKAALEWALEQETWIGPDDGGEWGIDKYEIEEELNAKTKA